MSEWDRVFDRLDQLDDKREKNHIEVVQRLKELETSRLEQPCLYLKQHLKEADENRQKEETDEKNRIDESRTKRLIDYAVKAAVVAGAAVFGSQATKWHG